MQGRRRGAKASRRIGLPFRLPWIAAAALLGILAVRCGAAGPPSRSPPAAGDAAAQESPPQSPATPDASGAPAEPPAAAGLPLGPAGDEVLDALELVLEERHHTEVGILQDRLDPRPDGSFRIFVVYAFNTFEAWRGEHRAAGDEARIAAQAEEQERSCAAEARARLTARWEEMQRVCREAEATGDEELRAECDHLYGQAQTAAASSTAEECDPWPSLFGGRSYADLERIKSAATDALYFAVYAGRFAAGSGLPVDLRSLVERSFGDGIYSDARADAMAVRDLDGDAAVEVFVEVRWYATEYNEGWGNVQPCGAPVEWLVFGEEGEVEFRRLLFTEAADPSDCPPPPPAAAVCGLRTAGEESAGPDFACGYAAFGGDCPCETIEETEPAPPPGSCLADDSCDYRYEGAACPSGGGEEATGDCRPTEVRRVRYGYDRQTDEWTESP
jgi:hypothetical protein